MKLELVDLINDDDFIKIYNLIQYNNVFITGAAGSGKSLIMLKLIKELENNKIKSLILCPTAVSAINVSGYTIHSFFGLEFNFKTSYSEAKYWKALFNVQIESKLTYYKKNTVDAKKGDVKSSKPGIIEYLEEVFMQDDYKYKNSKIQQWCKIYTKLAKYKYIFFDEISMVHMSLFDNIIKILNYLKPVFIHFKKQFPKIIAIGDFYQIKPIAKRYWGQTEYKDNDNIYPFNGQEWKGLNFINYYLKNIYRQKNKLFARFLNCVRKGQTNQLVETFIKYFNHNNVKTNWLEIIKNDPEIIYITSLNETKNRVNNLIVSKINGESKTYNAIIEGVKKESYQILKNNIWIDVEIYMYNNFKGPKRINTKYDYCEIIAKSVLAEKQLSLKIGQKVMFIKNKYYDKSNTFEYFNGQLGIIVSLNEKSIIINSNQQMIEVLPATWEIFEYNEYTNKENKPLASFSQFPIVSGYAYTYHKCQGLTLNKVIIDPNIFYGQSGNGMIYMALSRVNNYNNIFFSKNLNINTLRNNLIVDDFYDNCNFINYTKDEMHNDFSFNINNLSNEEKNEYLKLQNSIN